MRERNSFRYKIDNINSILYRALNGEDTLYWREVKI